MIEGYKIQNYHVKKKVCFGCIHHIHTLMRSGSHPVYRNACKHPKAVNDAYGKYIGTTEYEEGVTIGENIDTAPDWCPVGQRPEGEEP